jgi:hypothetical protein
MTEAGSGVGIADESVVADMVCVEGTKESLRTDTSGFIGWMRTTRPNPAAAAYCLTVLASAAACAGKLPEAAPALTYSRPGGRRHGGRRTRPYCTSANP